MSGSPRLFCFGLGFSATVLARRLLAEGWSVAGTSREESGLEAIRALGADALLFSPDHPLAAGALAGATHVLSSIPPSDSGDPVCEHDGITGATLKWVGYLSATSVYGDRGGELVSENNELHPVSQRARKRARAESLWLDLWREQDAPVHVFRLAGIYGPGRSAVDQVRAGSAKRIDKPGHRFSRIHVEDIASALIASMAAPAPGSITNLCDDEPAASAEVTGYACELLGVAPPPLIPFAEAEKAMSPMAREFWSDNRRIDNRRMHATVLPKLRYPTYREGIKAIVDGLGDTGLSEEG
jgi:hypothetical protein